MKGKKTLLAIDDDDIIRRCCERTLVPAGYTLHTASNGPDGLELVRKNQYDLILVDLKMPEMDGREVVEQILASNPSTKVVVVTGYATAETPALIMQMGASCFIEKPFSPKTLLKAVETILGDKKEKPNYN